MTISSTEQSRVFIEPHFLWDAQDAYLFDIDGTLLRARDRIHVDAFTTSIHRITGFEVALEGISMAGNTDPAILRQACRQAGIPAEIVEENLDAMLQAMCAGVAARRNEMHVERMPGVEDALRYLAGKGKLLGIASGNVETIGWIKVERAGLREWFRFGGFSDRYPVRSDLIGRAAQKAREFTGNSASICVIGDTPHDIAAARANSLSVIAVATGKFCFDDLMAGQPDVCATSLADLLAVTGGRA